jgi:hypothetical protein
MLGLQLTQLPLEPVIRLVGDFGPVENVIEPLVPPDLLAELLDSIGRLGLNGLGRE